MKTLIHTLKEGKPDIGTFRALHKAWGSPFSLRPVALLLAYTMALRSTYPILETGSGLSSLVLGCAAWRTGQSVTSLEHEPEFGTRTQDALDDLGIANVGVNVCSPTKPGFYDLPGLPKYVGMWLHDGPLNFDGRVAAFQVLAQATTHALIFVDDFSVDGYGPAVEAALATTHKITTVPEPDVLTAICIPRSTHRGQNP